MAKSIFFLKLISKGFLEDAKLDAEKRIKFNLRNIIRIFLFGLTIIIILIFCFWPNEEKRKISTANPLPEYPRQSGSNAHTTAPDADPKNTGNHSSSFGGGGIGYGGSRGGNFVGGTGSGSGRSRNANQVVRRGKNGNDPGAQMPIGTMIGATLVTAVHSGSSASPVIARITQEVVNDNGTSIPANTKIIGTSTFDEGSHRIQIRFSTLVYEDGSQHPIQAMAMMQDGSAGLDGDYHSGHAEQQVGKFIGNFVEGMAEGLKDQTSVGMFGNATTSGSVKNGLLTGTALSAQDESKYYSDSLTNQKPTMSINAGSHFFLFLEKEYLP
jgi:hypothetical protein